MIKRSEGQVAGTEEQVDEAIEVIDFTYSITAYGADYPVDSIVKRIEAKDIVVPRFNWDSEPVNLSSTGR